MSVLLTIKEALDYFLHLKLELGKALEAIEENGVDMSKGANDTNGCVFLLIHYLESKVHEQFGKNFKDEFGLEIFGGVCHDHRESFLEEVEETFFIVPLAKVNWEPVSNFLVV